MNSVSSFLVALFTCRPLLAVRTHQQGPYAGDNAYIKGAIIDDNAAIGRNVRITNAAGVKEADRTQEGYAIQDGIVVVLRGATIPDGTEI